MDIETRVGPLTWGQQIFWYYNQPTFREEWGHVPLISHRLALPEGTSAAALQSALDRCAERFEALRTVYEPPGIERPRQRVLPAYQPVMFEADAPDEPDFDLSRAPGFRCRIVRDGDAVVSADLLANQIDLDGHSMVIVERCILALLAGDADPFPSAVQPIDCAEAEGSRAGLIAGSGKGLAWHAEARPRVARNFAPLSGSDGATGIAQLRVPDLLDWAEQAARLSRTTEPTVLQAAIGLVLHGWLGVEDCLMSTAVSNRWRPGLRHAVGRFAAEIDWIFTLDPKWTADRFLQEVHATLLAGYRAGARDTGACTMAAVRDNCAFGSSMAKPVFIEYLDFLRDHAPLRHSVQDMEFRYETRPGANTRLRFDLIPRWPGMEIRLETDIRLASRSESELLLRSIASAVEALSEGPDRPLGAIMDEIAAPTFDHISRGPWIELGASRFSPRHVREAALGCEGVVDAAVEVGEDAASIDLHVVGAADLAAVHDHLSQVASNDPLVVVPGRYLAVPHLPGARQAVPEPGAVFVPRTDYRARIVTDARAAAVIAAVEECNPGLRADLARTYAENGGDYMMIPGIVGEIERQGYTRPHPDWFLGLASLAAIANGLRETDRRAGRR